MSGSVGGAADLRCGRIVDLARTNAIPRLSLSTGTMLAAGISQGRPLRQTGNQAHECSGRLASFGTVAIKATGRKLRQAIILSLVLRLASFGVFCERGSQPLFPPGSPVEARLNRQVDEGRASGQLNWVRSEARQTKPWDANFVRPSSCRWFCDWLRLAFLADEEVSRSSRQARRSKPC